MSKWLDMWYEFGVQQESNREFYSVWEFQEGFREEAILPWSLEERVRVCQVKGLKWGRVRGIARERGLNGKEPLKESNSIHGQITFQWVKHFTPLLHPLWVTAYSCGKASPPFLSPRISRYRNWVPRKVTEPGSGSVKTCVLTAELVGHRALSLSITGIGLGVYATHRRWWLRLSN